MGAKYSTVVISGFSANPPPDDGTQTEANKVKYSTLKTKLGDPLKTAIESINSGLLTALDYGSRQISASDSTVASDHMKTVEIGPTVSAAVTVSLGDAVTMAAGYVVTVKNSSANAQTVGRVTAGDKIDGVAGNVTIPSKGSVTFVVANTASEGYLIESNYGETDAVTLTGTQTLTNKTLTAAILGGTTNLSGGQIAFPASQSASADANTLDDYEEGTFTPVIAFGGASVGVTYTTQTGRYSKVGNRVFCDIAIFLSSKGSSSGAASITGLPFSNAAGHNPVFFFEFVGMTSSFITVMGLVSGTTISPIAGHSASGTANQGTFLANTDFGNTTQLYCSFSYQV